MKIRGGINELMRQASRVQRKVERRKEELKEHTTEATSANGQVKVVVNGAGELVELTIDPSLIENEDLGMLQDLIVAAANSALRESNALVEAELDKVSGGLNIPGLT